MMKLGKHFTLEEMIRTTHDWDNNPGNIHLVELTRLVTLVLDPLRKDVGRLDVTSGYRTELVNQEVKGARGSFHMLGCAADVVHESYTPQELIAVMRALKLPYDKLIAEDNGRSQWLHIQIQPAGTENRYKRYNAHMNDAGAMIYQEA